MFIKKQIKQKRNKTREKLELINATDEPLHKSAGYYHKVRAY